MVKFYLCFVLILIVLVGLCNLEENTNVVLELCYVSVIDKILFVFFLYQIEGV